jgi:hypothetical protein
MLLKIVYIALAVLAAWHSAPWLTSVFSFLPFGELADAIRPRNLFSHSPSFYVVFLLASVALWETLERTGLTFLLSGPQRYGNSRPVRRTQGLMAEGVILMIFMTPVLALLTLAGPGKTIILTRLEQDLGARFADAATAPMRSELRGKDQLVANNESERGALKIEQWWEGAKDWFRPAERQGEGTTRIQRKLDKVSATSETLRRDGALVEGRIMDFTLAVQSRDSQAVERARDAVWKDTSSWRISYLAFRHLWWLALPIAAPLHFYLHGYLKGWIGRVHKPIQDFIDVGRTGIGGSGRFATIFEEWRLVYGRPR